MSNGITNSPPDPEDIFKDTRMSFGDHLEELRLHLWRAIVGFIIASVAGFFVGKHVLKFIAAPVERQLMAFYEKRLQQVEAEQKTRQELIDVNKPTGWFELGVLPEQMGELRKDNIEAVNDRERFPQPRTVLPESPTEDEKRAAEEDEKRVARIWVRYQQPVEAAVATQRAQLLVGRRPALTTLNIQEAFMVYLKVSLATGFVIGSPWIFWQLWSFIAVGLYPSEKKLVHYYLPFSLLLFIGGILVCEFLVMPRAIEALLMFNEWLGLEPDLRLNEWLSFAVIMPLVFGLAFQTPLVMVFLTKVGIADADSFRSKRRMIWFIMVILAALITPSTDPWSLLLLWVPTVLLFELGIVLCARIPKTEWDEEEEERELIGV